MFTQHQYPGWQWMIDHGATTLWENWRGDESQNHPMMGDIAAWAVRYLGGIKMLEPQFRKFEFAPQIPDTLDSFSWKYKLQGGTLAISWQKLPGNKVEIKLAIPQGSSVEMADYTGEKSILQPGEYTFCRDLAESSRQ
jgi:alpha-L-rhamnosidase